MCALPLHEFNLMIYTTHLSSATSYTNIKLNIAAIKHFAILYHYHSMIPPLQRLYMLIHAIKRQHGNKFQRYQRLPITLSLLLQLKSYLTNSTYNIYDKNMLWAAFTCAFFGFLRSSAVETATVSVQFVSVLSYSVLVLGAHLGLFFGVRSHHMTLLIGTNLFWTYFCSSIPDHWCWIHVDCELELTVLQGHWCWIYADWYCLGCYVCI